MFILTWKFKAQLFHELPVIETGAEVCFIAVVENAKSLSFYRIDFPISVKLKRCIDASSSVTPNLRHMRRVKSFI